MNNFSSKDIDELKKHYFNYVEKKNFDKIFLTEAL